MNESPSPEDLHKRIADLEKEVTDLRAAADDQRWWVGIAFLALGISLACLLVWSIVQMGRLEWSLLAASLVSLSVGAILFGIDALLPGSRHILQYIAAALMFAGVVIVIIVSLSEENPPPRQLPWIPQRPPANIPP